MKPVSDPIRHFRDRQSGVLLKDIQNAGVDGIQIVSQGVSPDLVMAQ
jgi:hypothetical protein